MVASAAVATSLIFPVSQNRLPPLQESLIEQARGCISAKLQARYPRPISKKHKIYFIVMLHTIDNIDTSMVKSLYTDIATRTYFGLVQFAGIISIVAVWVYRNSTVPEILQTIN